MGSGSWSTDVPPATQTSSDRFKHSDEAAKAIHRTTVDPALLMTKGRLIVCKHREPVGIVIDGTGSMKDWPRTLRDKSMMFTGQVRCQNYLQDPAFNLSVIGDANPSNWGGPPDQAPIQMSEFVVDNESFKALTARLYLEGGGGGHAKESYELAMYAYARRVQLVEPGKGYIFILGDEGYYEVTKAEHLKRHFGEASPSSIQTSDIIAELKGKFRVFKIHINTNGYPEDEHKIRQQWQAAFGEHFIYLPDPNAVVDVMLGCIARTGGTRSLDEYIDQDMVERGQTKERRALIRATLQEIDTQL